MNYKKIYILAILLLSTLIMPELSANIGETLPEYTELPGSGRVDSFEGSRGVTYFLSRIIEKGIDITAMIAVIGVCIVGLMFITATGDPEKAKKATKYLGVIIIGVLIALGAYAIVALIDKIPNSFLFF